MFVPANVPFTCTQFGIGCFALAYYLFYGGFLLGFPVSSNNAPPTNNAPLTNDTPDIMSELTILGITWVWAGKLLLHVAMHITGIVLNAAGVGLVTIDAYMNYASRVRRQAQLAQPS